MKRRSFVALLCVAGAGCLDAPTAAERDPDDGGTPAGGTSTPRDASTDGTAAGSDDRMAVVVDNGRDSVVTVEVAIRRGDETVRETRLSVPVDERRSVAAGIERVGDYDLVARVVDGPTETFPFDVGEYELRSGSNIVVAVGADALRIRIEE